MKERCAREQRAGAPQEKPGAGEQQLDALNKNIGASTDIRIAPPKTFAALSKKHDASALNIGALNTKMIASSSGLPWSDDRLHGAAERVGASAKSIDATAERAGATETRAAATDERAAATKKKADAS